MPNLTGNCSQPDALFDPGAFADWVDTSENPLPLLRSFLKDGIETLKQRFLVGIPATELLPLHAWLVDQILIQACRLHTKKCAEQVALIAVGGYGRGTLHPYSDIDILLLLADETDSVLQEAIGHFISLLWDIGLEVGHSVRTVEECQEAARKDLVFITSLMEARLLFGPEHLFKRLQVAIAPEQMWGSRQFFLAKRAEQATRHHRYHDTAYNLEPNIKEGPGGLRDIQMIQWVSKRYFNTWSFDSLLQHGFLTPLERKELLESQDFFWQLRYGLHTLTGRKEDRLLFDYQIALAKQLGYRAQGPHLAVEQLMKDYYRTAGNIGRLNEMLLQLFEEEILLVNEKVDIRPINKRFQIRNKFLEVTDPQVFKHTPSALLEVFLLLQRHPELKGVRASTVRLIREHCYLIDDNFRADSSNRNLFMEIIRQPRGITHELRRMNKYGVLGAYLPAFGKIVGQMQYDMFHAYTVDEHTLFLIRNLRRFALPQYAHEFPLCSEVFQRISKPKLLYLAGLFHDIAKGRGGDHSELGAKDALEFCLHHGLSHYDSRFVAWLVSHHLLMSMTAQRQDINDPEVVREFAIKVSDEMHLNYLYLLTVADIRATNPNLWNSWKDALLSKLYTATHQALRRGLEHPIDKAERIRDVQDEARQALLKNGWTEQKLDALWKQIDADYFLRHTPNEICWHIEALDQAEPSNGAPRVLVRPHNREADTADTMEVFIYARAHALTFTVTTGTMAQLDLDVLDARIITTCHGFVLESFIVREATAASTKIDLEFRLREIQETLTRRLTEPDQVPSHRSRFIPRRLKVFKFPTRITFTEDCRNCCTVMELTTNNWPGLLSRISQALANCQVQLVNAKITTLGTQVVDVFFICNQEDQPLTPQQQQQLENTIHTYLER
ncbi:protein-P-II uridylyltransferase [Nitrosococcus halophilus Nc 4]|uniref:Bifunctional uridylyltransferase/uridylyl-removing enzyme n=1 Tax=Nitrosococcus halophilus (strain Nc4) TaxID=472759 RepID=D5BVV9_NITHN|nr:[protein-PII] uridylyltransferase [Nitrosococcus halophilus]ADE15538.1 protein-P-II uridylyltransferase [Nitrosococcus halophilus Nc 4]